MTAAPRRATPLEQIAFDVFIAEALDDLLQDYVEAVEASGMSENSKYAYGSGADMFVRWVKGEFQPGGTLK